MAFFSHVNPGDPVKPSTSLENNVRDMINRFNATGELPVSRGAANSYRLQCWNNNDYVIPAGASVEIVAETEWLSNGVPAIKFAATDATVWGVAEAAITPGSIGSVLFGGIVYLSSLINVGRYVVPSGYGGYSYSDEGCLIIGQINGRSIAMLGQQSTPRYLFGVNVILGVDADGKTHTYANIYRVPEWIKVFGYTKASPLIPTVIDITEALAQGSVEIGVKIVGNDNEDITVGNPVCQYVINGSQDSRPLQPWAKFATITMSSTAGAKVSAIPYNNGVFDIDGFSGVPSCWSYYNNGEIKIVCPETYAITPNIHGDVQQAIFDYVDNYVLYCVLTYNDADSTYSAAWQWSDITTMKNTEMYIPVLYNYNDDKMTAKTYFNFFTYYLL